MKIFGKTLNLPFTRSVKSGDPVASKEQFITNILRTRAFAKLSLQDKVLSLGRLIMMFRSDWGFTPPVLERTLDVLNSELNQQAQETWHRLYSDPLKEGAT
jgi:hypothetical protein